MANGPYGHLRPTVSWMPVFARKCPQAVPLAAIYRDRNAASSASPLRREYHPLIVRLAGIEKLRSVPPQTVIVGAFD